MPTSAQDPALAKRQRDSLRATETLEEREWVPLWLAGPLLGLLGVFGMTTIIWAILVLVERVTK